MASAYLEDGFSTTYTLALYPSIKFKEKTVTPPGVQGGGKNDVTSMRNTRYRTFAPKKLLTITDIQSTVFYDPTVFTDIIAACQVVQLVTVRLSDGTTHAVYGWVDEFLPQECKDGEAPMAKVTICVGNRNTSQVETAPVVTSA